MHPRETGKRDYIKLCMKHYIKEFEVLGKESNLHDLIRKSSLVIAYGSTACIEAIAYGKQVILYNLFPWHHEGEQFVEGFFNARDKYKYVTQNLLLDHQATERNVKLIQELAHANQ